MNVIDEAMKVIAKNPLDSDARKQVDLLYKEATEDEKFSFAMIYEGLSHSEMKANPVQLR